MIAYNATSLDNRNIQLEAGEALEKKAISPEEYNAIIQAHPFHFYTPNALIRVGLFALTGIILLFTLGIFILLAAISNGNTLGGLLVVTGILIYVVLEYIVHGMRHFRSGIDDGLLWIGHLMIITGFSLLSNNSSPQMQCYLILLLALWGAIRFADCMMALVAYAALLRVVFYTGMHLGSIGKSLLPFLIMAVSAGIYTLVKSLAAKEKYRHYLSGLTVVTAATLLSFCAAGNYFVVRELSISLLNSPPSAPIPLGGLFWLQTVIIPLLYIARGIQKKDVIFLWAGLILAAAAVFTIRHYYHLLPLEWALVIGGILLIALAYIVMRYLRTPKHGFTAEETDTEHILASLHVESLVIAETFHAVSTPSASNDFQFGGGSGGGGGAGGEY